jgi:hypothetical protein
MVPAASQLLLLILFNPLLSEVESNTKMNVKVTMLFVSQLCCDTTCTRNYKVYHVWQQQISQYYCLNNHRKKYNQVVLFATIAATLQGIFKTLHSVTSLLQLVSQCLYTEWLLTVNLAALSVTAK